jgi:hypothetical protein
MRVTSIEWCDSTVNPVADGCVGCELWVPRRRRSCYAGRFTERTKGKGKFDQPPTLYPGRRAWAAQWPDLTGHAGLNQLEREMLDLKILNDGKDFVIKQLREERDGFIQGVDHSALQDQCSC